MYYVYILHSLKNNSLYIGFTTNLVKRIKKHNKGENKATKPFVPYKLIHYEGYVDKRDAKAREIYLKSGWGRRSINIMLKYYINKGR
jgi:putative endonuclease